MTKNVNVTDFGAKGDGITDDTAAIQSALDSVSGDGVVNLDAANYKITNTLTVRGNVSIMGAGQQLSIITWFGPPLETMLSQTGTMFGAIWSGFKLECNRIAGIGISLDRAISCEFRSICVAKAQNIGIKMCPTVADSDCMMNVFTNVYISGENSAKLTGSVALWLGTAAEGVNCCHNTFVGLKVEYGKTGILFGDADNNCFLMTYTYAMPNASVPAYAVDFAGGAASRSNYFFHFQGLAHASSGSINCIEQYDTSNGQQAPIVEEGGILEWRESGQGAYGDYRRFWTHSLSEEIGGADWVPNNTVWAEPHAFKIVRNDNGQQLAVSLKNNPRQAEFWVGADGRTVRKALSLGQGSIGFFDSNVTGRPTVYGSISSGSALSSLIKGLARLGLIQDSTTP